MEREPSQPRDLYKLLYPIARTALNFKFNRYVQGEENILDEPAIYAANHILAADSLLVSTAYTEETGRPLRFAVKQGYLDGTGVDDKGKYGKSARFLMKHTLQVPVKPEGGDRAAQLAFEEGVRRTLERGDSFAIHPEGTRSTDGRLHKFKAGVARLAIANNVPIVPVGLVYDMHTNTRKIDVEILFGQPFMPDELHRLPYTAIPGLKYKADHVTQVIENRVADLTNMDQTGAFAVLRKFRHLNEHE
ncbi:MAG: lysophospholipid acyltransferase family protein [Candidatus Microsaccharimonas sp.]